MKKKKIKHSEIGLSGAALWPEGKFAICMNRIVLF